MLVQVGIAQQRIYTELRQEAVTTLQPLLIAEIQSISLNCERQLVKLAVDTLFDLQPLSAALHTNYQNLAYGSDRSLSHYTQEVTCKLPCHCVPVASLYCLTNRL